MPIHVRETYVVETKNKYDRLVHLHDKSASKYLYEYLPWGNFNLCESNTFLR